MDIGKPFIQIGKHLINMNAIVAVIETKDGHLRVLTTAIRKGGASQVFTIPAGENAAEFRRQIDPYIGVHAESVESQEE
jgi:hypothetical protein